MRGQALTPILLAIIGLFSYSSHAISLEVSSQNGNSSGALPVGLMFEDVNHGGDGGIHGQLLGDNAFQGTNASLARYAPIGNVQLEIDSSKPLTSAIARSLKVTVPKDAVGQVGFSNDGYWGIKLPDGKYSTFFWMSGEYQGDITVKLAPKKSYGTEFGSTTIATNESTKWAKYESTLDVKAAPDGDNVWSLTFDASKVAGSSVHFDLISLYPPTYQNKVNGLKPELAQPLADLKGRFLRFPGGNNLEGDTIAGRLRWNETIGPLEDRPGRQGVWKYANTDALGLLEYLEWAEYMELEPLLDIFAGLALGDPNGPITGDALEFYIDDALNQIEYVVGDSSSFYGGLRGKHGHPEPFKLKYIEIGNEDNLSGGCASYVERFQRFFDAIHKAHPHLVIIASTADDQCLPNPKPDGAWLDYHRYDRPDRFVEAFGFFDNIPRTNKYVVNEFAVIDRNDGSKPDYPWVQASVAEAVYIIGMQRNSDLIQGIAYAPLIAHLNANELYRNWNPSLISFRNQPPSLVLSTSYYVQQMFSLASSPSDTYLDVTSDSDFGPVYWVASRTHDAKSIIKLANYGSDPKDISVNFSTSASKASITTLTGDVNAQNDEANPNTVIPSKSEVEGQDGKFEVKMPAWSVVILRTI